MLKGFAMGTALSAAIAARLVIGVIRTDQDQRVLGDVLSAHVRSLQADHLTDVQTSDQHTVKPWFNGKVDVAPPVVDLTAQGFTLIGGRLDYIDGKAVASIVYRRRAHMINLFVMPGAASAKSRGEARNDAGVQHPALECAGSRILCNQRHQRRRAGGIRREIRRRFPFDRRNLKGRGSVFACRSLGNGSFRADCLTKCSRRPVRRRGPPGRTIATWPAT